jgi:uncharacterized membrane protein YjgN (DUF898 family)
MRDIWHSLLSMRPGAIHVEYAGSAPQTLVIALRNGLLTVLTLGLFRFWAVIRMRRYLTESIVVQDTGLTFDGTGGQALRRFLVLAPGVAVWLAAANGLMYFLGVLTWPFPPVDPAEIRLDRLALVSAVAMLPLVGAILYQARRYRLNHTSWHGVRFTMEDGALGYSMLWMLWTVLAVASLGLLWPMRGFVLESYCTGRVRFGKLQMRQMGSRFMLYRPFLPVVLSAATAALVLWRVDAYGLPGMLLDILAVASVPIAYAHYRVRAFALLTANKRLGASMRLRADLDPASVIVSIVVALALVALAVALVIVTVASVLVAGHVVGEVLAGWRPGPGNLLPRNTNLYFSAALPGRELRALDLAYVLPSLVLGGAIWAAFARQEILSQVVACLELNRSEELDAMMRGYGIDAGLDRDSPAEDA